VGNVLDLLLAQILKDEGQAVANLIVDLETNTPPVSASLDPGRDVDAIAIEIVALDDHIGEIDADAQFDVVVRRDAGIPLGHSLLRIVGRVASVVDAVRCAIEVPNTAKARAGGSNLISLFSSGALERAG
jgi:hypothetical protein